MAPSRHSSTSPLASTEKKRSASSAHRATTPSSPASPRNRILGSWALGTSTSETDTIYLLDVNSTDVALARLFREECGLTFTAWRQRVRFHAAVEALSRMGIVVVTARDGETGMAQATRIAVTAGYSPEDVAALLERGLQ